MSYQIITDSCADLTDVQLKQWDVSCVNLTLRYNGENHSNFSDPAAVKAFYDEMRNGTMATTAAANPEEWAAVMRAALDAGRDVLVITFSSGMSTTYQSAVIASQDLQEEYPERTILVVDSLCAALGQGLLVYHACRKRDEGMDIRELAAWVEEHRLNLCHWVTVDTFDHLKHGGRVSATSAAMGTLLGIKPLIHVDENGKLVAVGKPRGKKKALEALVSNMEKGWQPEISKQVIIGHGDSLEVARELRDLVAARFPEAEILIAPIGPVIGAHAGPGVMTVFFWGNNH